MCRLMETTGAVIQGRGGAAFLGHDPRCFHVRLDGPRERRIRQAMEIEGIGEDEARRRQTETDRARSFYIRRFYGREAEVLQLFADGCSTVEVGQRLYISAKTVKNHLASIYEKLDARDRTQAVLTAVRMGIIRLN